jgi:NAD(P)-dependent dehydrogenase (short-subunit alcohol dehydrogenase family)
MASSDAPENIMTALPRPVPTYHSKTYDRLSPRQFDGAGKTVVITAGATGIGLATAKAFAESGVARLVLIQRTEKVLKEAQETLHSSFPKIEVLTFAASLDDFSRIEAILQELQTIDALILSAAATHPAIPSSSITLQQFHETIKTNLEATFNITKAYLALPTPPSDSVKSKTIIHISSASAQMTIPCHVGYGPSKAAASQLMQHFAGEYKPVDGVRIFSFHPGVFYTPMTAREYDAGMFEWEDIDLPAHFCTWLMRSEADFLHGRYLWAHWDVDELVALREKVVSNPAFLTIGLVM